MAGIGKYEWINYDEYTSKNYQTAINYYNQKTNIILNNLLTQLNKKLIEKGLSPCNSTEELIEVMSAGLDDFITQWEKFYNSRPDVNKFKAFARQYNDLMSQENEHTKQIMSRAQIVKLLITNEIITEEMGDVLPPTLDFSSVQADINALASGVGNIGNRTNIMSEIFEQGGRYFSNAIGDIINEFVVGTGRILNSSGKQIKPDALITFDTTLRTDLQTKTRMKDLSLSIDLEKNIINLDEMSSVDQIIEAVGLTNEALGITMKMWTSRARHKTMGSFLSQGDIDRDDIHSQDSTRRLYNAYVHSKYLINIIGALNGLIVGGSNGLERTDMFLQNIFDKGKGIMAANDILSKKSGLEIKPRYTKQYQKMLKNLST